MQLNSGKLGNLLFLASLALANPIGDPSTRVERQSSPYAQGECSLHLTQWDNSWGGPIHNEWHPGTRYEVEVTMHDDSGNQIGYQRRIGAGNPDSINMVSKLEGPLNILPESQGNGNVGYIAFSLPNQAWPSDQACSNPHVKGDAPVPCCTMGGWDGSNTPAYRQMDCFFHCGWGGGRSSDGS